MTHCKLYKFMIESHKEESIETSKFYAYHMSEKFAKEAAMRWGKTKFPKTKVKVYLID